MKGLCMVFVVCAAVLFACPSALAAENQTVRVDVWALEAAQSWGESLDAIIEKLGEPRRREVKQQPNRRDQTATDILESLVYDGLRVETKRKEDGSEFAMLSVETTSPQYPFGGVRVGEASKALTKILGFPDQRTARELRYDGHRCALAASIEQGRIAGLEILFWPD